MWEMRICFDRSNEIDRRRREVFCEAVKVGYEEYDAKEEEALKEGMKMFSHFEVQRAKVIAMATPSTRAKVAQVDNAAWGWASGTVRTNATDLLAHVWDTKSAPGRSKTN